MGESKLAHNYRSVHWSEGWFLKMLSGKFSFLKDIFILLGRKMPKRSLL